VSKETVSKETVSKETVSKEIGRKRILNVSRRQVIRGLLPPAPLASRQSWGRRAAPLAQAEQMPPPKEAQPGAATR